MRARHERAPVIARSRERAWGELMLGGLETTSAIPAVLDVETFAPSKVEEAPSFSSCLPLFLSHSCSAPLLPCLQFQRSSSLRRARGGWSTVTS